QNKLVFFIILPLLIPMFGELYLRFIFQVLFLSLLIWDISHTKDKTHSPPYNLFSFLLILVYLTSLFKTFFKEINYSLLLPLLGSESDANLFEALSLSGFESFNTTIYALEFIQLWKLGEIIIRRFRFIEFDKSLGKALSIYVPILPFILIFQIKN